MAHLNLLKRLNPHLCWMGVFLFNKLPIKNNFCNISEFKTL